MRPLTWVILLTALSAGSATHLKQLNEANTLQEWLESVRGNGSALKVSRGAKVDFLNTLVVPRRQLLAFALYHETSFRGRGIYCASQIFFECLEPTKTLTVHVSRHWATDLYFNVYHASGTIDAWEATFDGEVLTVKLEQLLKPGVDYVLNIAPVEPLDFENEVLGVTAYDFVDGETGDTRHYYVKSQAPNATRLLAASFDDPTYKLEYSWSVSVFYGDEEPGVPLTNGAMTSAKDYPEYNRMFYTFDWTPPITTDALQFAIVPKSWIDGPHVFENRANEMDFGSPEVRTTDSVTWNQWLQKSFDLKNSSPITVNRTTSSSQQLLGISPLMIPHIQVFPLQLFYASSYRGEAIYCPSQLVFECSEPTNRLTVHAGRDWATVLYASVGNSEESIAVVDLLYDGEVLYIELEEPVKVHVNYTLLLAPPGPVPFVNDVFGISRHSRSDPGSGEVKPYYVKSQAPNATRLMAGCFDDPSYKVQYVWNVNVNYGEEEPAVTLIYAPLSGFVHLPESSTTAFSYEPSSPMTSNAIQLAIVPASWYAEFNITSTMEQ